MAYTKADQDKSIATLRALAASGARVGVYYEATTGVGGQGVRVNHGWEAEAFFLNDDGTNRLRVDGSRVSPAGEICATEARAIEVATAHNIDSIDQVNHPKWFTRGRSIRNARYPREKSDALSA